MKNLQILEDKIRQQIARYFSTYGETSIGHESRSDLFELISHEFVVFKHKEKWDGIYEIDTK
jgi:hypothetical protein|tara:strand:+ start:380 stop:565 length:186 start_codon:yes stop_codon:yes gene_type:complete